MKTSNTKRNIRSFFVLVVGLGFIACAPKQVNRVYNEHPLPAGARVSDPELDFDTVQQSSARVSAMLRWNGQVQAHDFFNATEDLLTLSQIRNDAALSRLAVSMQNSYYAQPTVSFSKSPYALAAVGETEKDSLAEIDLQSKSLGRQPDRVQRVLNLTSSQYPIPTQFKSPAELVLTAKGFLDLFLKNLKRSDVDPRVRSAIAQRINSTVFPELVHAHEDILIVFNQPDSVDFLHGLQAFLLKYKLGLDSETNAKINEVVGLLEEVKAIASPQDVLSSLISLWEILTPAQREANFKLVSSSLYNFLKIQTPLHLRCLKHQACPDPLLQIIMHTVILPAIDSRGVGQIRNQIIESVRSGVVEQVYGEAGSQFQKLPELVGSEVSDEIQSLLKVLKTIRRDYGGFLNGVIGRVAASPGFLPAKANGKITGFEPEFIKVSLSGRESVSAQAAAVKWTVSSLLDSKLDTNELKNRKPQKPSRPPETSSLATTGASAIGAGFSAAVARLQNAESVTARPDLSRQILLTQINKLLALSGFHMEGGKLFDSFFREVTPKGFSGHLDLRNYLNDTSRSYAVADQIALDGPFDMSSLVPSHGGETVSAGEQARMMRGLTALMRFSQDWNSNSFDSLLGGVTIDRFVKELPPGSVHESLFPKDLIFAASLGATAVLLERIANQNTPVFLIGLNQQTFWANALLNDSTAGGSVPNSPMPASNGDKDHGPAAMAGVVSTQLSASQLVRGELVRTEDVAQTILGLCEFLQATSEISKTKNDLLIAKGKDGKNAVDTINDVRGQLQLLVLAFSNFISHQMQSTDGGIAETFNRANFASSQTPRRLKDQTIAIRALIAAGNTLDMNIYRWAALDAYAFMNRTLYDANAGFYADVVGGHAVTGDLPALLGTLRAGESLRPLMEPRSQTQWDQLASRWYDALDRF